MKRKLWIVLLACVMCFSIVTAIAAAPIDGEEPATTATITFDLNGGFTFTDDPDGNYSADSGYTEADITYTTTAGKLTFTHALVQQMFNNRPVLLKAAAETVEQKMDETGEVPLGDRVKNGFSTAPSGYFTEITAEGYYNPFTVGEGSSANYTPLLFGVFVDTNGNGVVDGDEVLYQSGDEFDLTGDVTLTCYYNPNMYFSTQRYPDIAKYVQLDKAYTDTAFKQQSEENPGGIKEHYTARDLQPFYFILNSIGYKGFAADSWSSIIKTIELPDTVDDIQGSMVMQISTLQSITGMNNVASISNYGLYNCSSDVPGRIEYVIGGLTRVCPYAFCIGTKANSTRIFIFDGADENKADEEIYKILSGYGYGSEPNNIFFDDKGGGREDPKDRYNDFTNPSMIAYVPFGETALWYPNEADYASGKTSFSPNGLSISESDRVTMSADSHMNMPMREMLRVSFDLNGGTIGGETSVPMQYMDAGAVSVIRGGVEVNITNDVLGRHETVTNRYVRAKNEVAPDYSLLGVTKPANPTLEGYAFFGWEDQYGNLWTEADWLAGGKMTDDYGAEGIVLKAKYTPQISVTYKQNNGQQDIVLPQVASGSLLAAPATPIALAWHEFDGWYTDNETFENKWDFATDVAPSTDLTLYAKFVPGNVSLRLIVNGGAISDAAAEVAGDGNYVVKYKYDVGLATIPAAAKAGYEFDGWFSDTSLSTQVTEIAANTAVETLYAKYTKLVVNSPINYNLDGGVLPTGAPTTYTEGTELTLPTPTRDGYIFEGWFRLASHAGKPVTSIAASSTGAVNLYAKWSAAPVECSITYNLDGGTNASGAPATYTEGTEVTLPVPTKEGFIFDGWYKEASFTNKIPKITADTTGDVVVYAKWTVDASATPTTPNEGEEDGGKKGCKGSVTAASAVVMTLVCLGAVAVVALKKSKKSN